jgi:hypothetical protein
VAFGRCRLTIGHYRKPPNMTTKATKSLKFSVSIFAILLKLDIHTNGGCASVLVLISLIVRLLLRILHPARVMRSAFRTDRGQLCRPVGAVSVRPIRTAGIRARCYGCAVCNKVARMQDHHVAQLQPV